VSHNVGRIVTVTGTRIGPDTGTPPTTPGVWELAFTPQPALTGGTPRFVLLHLTAMSLPGTSRVEVELGYSQDVFTVASGADVWTRPVDPAPGPVLIRYFGSGTVGGVTLSEYGSGEPWTTTWPPDSLGNDRSFLNSVTNTDLFLHTDPYAEPTYQTWLKCMGAFDWQNAACAPAGSVREETARAVGMIVSVHHHPESHERRVSTCSGTLIDTNVFLTALHCLTDPGEEEVQSGSVTFDYETTCAGGRPAGYSPTFHKVRRKIQTGTLPGLDGDWALLEIDPAPTGIVPRTLRPTAPMSGEPVFTVHHPNGAVKKLQSGTLPSGDVHLVTNFDYAGGSSGSALFDAVGRVVGAALSTGSGCQVAYNRATDVLAAIANPPAAPTPLDIMIVVDRSGSMALSGTSGTGRTKMDEAKDAASLFVQLVRMNAGDRIGMVSFSTSATHPPETPPGNVNPGRKQQLVGSAPYTGGTVGALAPGGWTSIGDGLREAIQALGSTGNQRAILLLTDGMQNTPPTVESVEATLGDTQLCIVGFGNEADLDGVLLSRLAREHPATGARRGMYTRANDGLALKKFFALCFGNIFASGTLIDPESTLLSDATTPAELAFDVCDENQITLVVGWDVPGAPVEAALVTPAGTIVTSTATGTTSDAGTTWRFLRVGLPLQGEREGTWKARVWRRPPGELEELGPDLRYFVSVIADGGPLLTPLLPSQRLYTGDAVNPTVALRYADQTAPHADVELSVEAPGGSLGDLVMQHGLTEPDPNAEPIDSFRATLQQLAAEAGGELPLTRTTRTLELFDDGVHDDGAMESDGIYAHPVDDLLRFEGSYTFHAVATYGETCAGRREAMWTLNVDPGIDPGRSEVRLVGSTIRFTPRDRYGNPLGPGRSGSFVVTAQPGSQVTGPVSDNGDGSYDVPVTWTGDGPSVAITQPERPSISLTPSRPSGGRGSRCPRWLCWLLALLVLLLLIALIIALVT
jgi:trypsin-like peptidase/VWA domain-containing protein